MRHGIFLHPASLIPFQTRVVLEKKISLLNCPSSLSSEQLEVYLYRDKQYIGPKMARDR